MWIKAYPGYLYVVVLGSKRALEPALFSAPIGVAVGGDSGQLTRGEYPPAIPATVWGQQQPRY